MYSYIFVLISFISLSSCEGPVVEISNGKIQGEIMFTPYNRSFYAFRGIPYAKPPVGKLRFQPPQKPENWTGVLDSDAKDRVCIQMGLQTQPNESEDCLYIHVYTPQIPENNEPSFLPVMYVIHGGGFVNGSATIDELGPHYLMDYDIVVVTVGYRLGLLGFLSTGDLNSPGNYGLKDQQHGLRWVQENIRYFGGNPKKVTIFGESAGGASVGLHLVAENAQGLFVGAMQDSGSSLGLWAVQKNPKELAYTIAKQVNSTIDEINTSTSELMEIFRNLNISQIKKACVEIFKETVMDIFINLGKGISLSGAIEPEHEGAFLTKSPYQKFSTGAFTRVPTLQGINSEECIFMGAEPSFRDMMARYDNNTENYVPPDMNLEDLQTMKLVGKKIANIYSSSGPLHENLAQSIKFHSDSTFGRPGIKQAEFQSEFTDVYFYEFEYSGQMGKVFPLPEVPGAGKVGHYEEMMYLFHSKYSKDIFSFPEEDRTTMKRMLIMWTNFVKFHNPTPKPMELLENIIWPTCKRDKMTYLSINSSLAVKYDLKKDMMDGFEELYKTYAIPPLITY